MAFIHSIHITMFVLDTSCFTITHIFIILVLRVLFDIQSVFSPSLLCRLCILIVSIIAVFGVDHLIKFLTRTNFCFLFLRCIPVDLGPNVDISIHLWHHEARSAKPDLKREVQARGTSVKPHIEPFLVSSVQPFHQTITLNEKWIGNGEAWIHNLLHCNPMP